MALTATTGITSDAAEMSTDLCVENECCIDNEHALAVLQEILGYQFTDRSLLQEALSHKSLGNARSNEKLEWLGDAVLSAVISLILRQKDRANVTPMSLKVLSQARTNLIKGSTQRRIAERLNLARWLITAKGVSDVFKDKMEEDLVEAIIGAICEDGGFNAAMSVVENLFTAQYWKEAFEQPAEPKAALQEFAASLRSPDVPKYTLISKSGPGNQSIMNVSVQVLEYTAEGSDTSLTKAESEAASKLLRILKEQGVEPLDPKAKMHLLELCHTHMVLLPEFSTQEQTKIVHEADCNLTAATDCRCAKIAEYICECSVFWKDELLKLVRSSFSKAKAEQIASHDMIRVIEGKLNNKPAMVESVMLMPQTAYIPPVHPKNYLFEYAAAHNHAPPQFTMVDHVPARFTVVAVYPSKQFLTCSKSAESKKAAELAAAKELMERLRCLEE